MPTGRADPRRLAVVRSDTSEGILDHVSGRADQVASVRLVRVTG